MNQTIKRVAYKGLEEEQAIVPNRWQGEADCVIGPFASYNLAECFARPAVDFGHYDSKVVRIFVRGGRWYVELAAAHSRRVTA